MPFFSCKKVFCLLCALIMPGCFLSASAAEPVTAAITPPTVAPAISATADAVPAETSAPVAVLPTTPSATPPANVEPTAPEKDTVTAESIKAADIAPAPALLLESEEQKRAYASGVILAHLIEEQLAQQKSLHITLNKNILLAGIADTFTHQVKMSDNEIRQTMAVFDEQVRVLTQAQSEKKHAEDKVYVEAFSKREGVKKTKQGLLYHIDNLGEGSALKDTDTVQVSYKGTLVDGTVVDAPKIDNANEIFRVANMPPVLRDSVKLIREGGQVTVVIPPATLEKPKGGQDVSPLNTVVIYTISVVAVNRIN